MIDNYRHKGLRRQLVEAIRSKGFNDQKVLDAIGKIPRHQFLDSSFTEYAYQDKPFPIGSGQTISQPYTVAFMTGLLDVKQGDKVLEVGTGSGYQACVLLELGARVYSIERQKKLFQKTKTLLNKMGYDPMLFYGDGYKGLPSYSPFDSIIITAGAPEVPKDLLKQLKIGGKMVVPVGVDNQIMHRIIRTAEDDFVKEKHGHFRFVPMLKDKAKDM
ncbi:MAG: protein-L-isoaspartate(D-aspartate) O-methyltransferase [Bacteroidales bacterium]|nr:protein-L-isoaspartate(D-aspartate) O-methyltransferase [Bacteroidales bacterium]